MKVNKSANFFTNQRLPTSSMRQGSRQLSKRRRKDFIHPRRQNVTPHLPVEEETKPVLPKPDLFKPEEPFEKPAFLPPKPLPLPHPPKISPSSIPNPSPSVSTSKPSETGFPNYGGYLYSIPGYSAFQPVSFPSIVQPHPGPVPTEPRKPDFVPFHTNDVEDPVSEDRLVIDEDAKATASKQQDFEDHFTPKIIPATSVETHSKTQTESKMSITSLTQGSGATVTIPNQVNKDIKKKQERFSLKTSIPISKIDIKCVNNSVDTFHNSIKKPVFNPAFQKDTTERPKVEIQSNIVIKTATKQAEAREKTITQNNSINTLINAAEAISKNDSQFITPETKSDAITQPPERKKTPSPKPQSPPAVVQRPMYNPINLEKPNFPLKPPEGGFNEPKNQVVYIQNKAVVNQKMMVTLQSPSNPQVLLQRTNFDSKNLQAPSRLSNLKKSKEEMVADNGTSSKVVALKRLHQENCDENDFENLITENQIYGNKIVVKEKSQGIQQEQDLKTKCKDKQIQSDPKNVVLQPSYVYVSNVQFPANLMMIKTNSKTCQTTDSYKTKVSPNENKTTEAITTVNNNNYCEAIDATKNCKPQIVTSKDVHILKSSNVLQSLSNNNNKKSDIVITTNQKVIMSSQVAYQVISDQDIKNQQAKEAPKVILPKKELPKLIEMKGPDNKMIIACQYKLDSKSHPKLVIANIKPKIATKIEVVSTLDIYARRKRLRRLKYLLNKEMPKSEARKLQEKPSAGVTRNIITPDRMKAEIFKEFANTKEKSKSDIDESDSDYGEEELAEYNSIIEEYGSSNHRNKIDFLAGLRLATHDTYREKHLEKRDRNLKHDSVATAYIASGISDKQAKEPDAPKEDWALPTRMEVDSEDNQRLKQKFLSQLQLKHVSKQFKEAYERTWQQVLRERRRRSGLVDPETQLKPPFDPNTQLQLLTEIKHCVNINNNLIKKRLDLNEMDSSDIKILAEKNFSILNRLSKMADRSVKLLSGQDTKKRDLNPGFDSENIQKLNLKIEPYKDYSKLVIPDISKIVSLKTAQENPAAATTQATSMDEPVSCAAGVSKVSQEVAPAMMKEFGCQLGDNAFWPGVEAFIKSYREYEKARKKEIASLHLRNKHLCVESAHVTRAASLHSDRARALLAERRHLAGEENNLRTSLQRLCAAVQVILKS